MSRLTAILINLLGIFLIGFFLILPQYRTLSGFRLEIQEKTTELQYKEEYFSNIKKTSEELKKYESELSKIDSALPLDPSLPSLFNFLEKTSSQNGLILKYTGPFYIAFPEGKQIREIRLETAFAGSYSALKNFLSALEITARFIEVENLYFTFPGEDEPFTFNLKIKAHSY